MPSTRQFLDELFRIARLDHSAGWDPVGIQLGDPGREVTRVAVCHEVDERVVAHIVADPVDLLISYHPLLFRPTTRLVAGRSPDGRAFRLLDAGSALAVVHTAYDAAPGGTADALAEHLGLVEVTGFGPMESGERVKVVTFVPAADVEVCATAMERAGGGRVGRYAACSFRVAGTGAFTPLEGADPASGVAGQPSRDDEVRIEMDAPGSRRDAVVAAAASVHPYDEPAIDVYPVVSNMGFVGRVGRVAQRTTLGELSALAAGLCAAGLRVSGDRDAVIDTVAVVPGSGSAFLGAAAASGADVIVTGDVAHHRVVEARDRGLAVIDPGHAATERPGVGRLAALVEGMSVDVVDLTSVDPTPWTA